MQKVATKPGDASANAAATVTVVLPPALVTLFPGSAARLEVTAASVNGMLDELDSRWPGMARRLRDERPAIRKHINIFVDGRRARLDTPLTPGTTVYVLTAMSGG